MQMTGSGNRGDDAEGDTFSEWMSKDCADGADSSPPPRAPLLLEVLQSLVRTPSANPGNYETKMAQCVKRWLSATNVEVTTVEFAAGRPSIAAVVRGGLEGPSIVLNGHMDTVPVGDETLWTVGPYDAHVRDGYVYGRGACDMKAGLAIEIAMAHYFAKRADRLRGNLVLHFAAGEERGEPGTLSLLDAGYTGDYGITLEPTDLRVATATRGVARFLVTLRGKASHSGLPDLGENPIWPLKHLIEELESYDREARLARHPLLPSGSATPTMVRSGVSENSVPDDCQILIDRRLLPGETTAREEAILRQHLENVGRRVANLRFDLQTLVAAEPANVDPSSAFVELMLRTVAEVRQSPAVPPWGAPFGSDVRNLVNDAGMEAVTFGPGRISDCHCADERVEFRQVEEAAAVIWRVIAELLGVHPGVADGSINDPQSVTEADLRKKSGGSDGVCD